MLHTASRIPASSRSLGRGIKGENVGMPGQEFAQLHTFSRCTLAVLTKLVGVGLSGRPSDSDERPVEIAVYGVPFFHIIPLVAHPVSRSPNRMT
jgi:hypothetical protein